MRWGPVGAYAVAAGALVAAAFTGITAFDGTRRTRFGMARLDGLVGETLVVVALVLVGSGVAYALRKLPAPAPVALGLVAVVSIAVSRASLLADADSVVEFIDGQGEATGIDSALSVAAGGRVTGIDVDQAAVLLATAAAACLVAVAWVGVVELSERRRRLSAATSGPTSGPTSGLTSGPSEVSDPNDPLTGSSQVPHT